MQHNVKNTTDVSFSVNNQNVKRSSPMNMAQYVSVSELSRNPFAAVEGLEQTYRTILRHNQPIGHLIGVEHPLSKLVGIAPPIDDLDQLESFFEKSMQRHWQQLFMQMHGVEPTKGAHCIDRLIGVENPELMRQLPGKDHYTLWERNGVPALFTMQVYTMHMDTHSALRDFCIKHGLVYNTEGRGWYFPGVSTLIVIEKNKEGADRS